MHKLIKMITSLMLSGVMVISCMVQTTDIPNVEAQVIETLPTIPSPTNTIETESTTEAVTEETTIIDIIEEVETEPTQNIEETTEPVTEPPTEEETVMEEVEEEYVSVDIMDDELELLALVTVAEAEGESEEGKRLVIDTILNRVDSDHFPNTISDVIYQSGQFTSMWNGRADSCYVTDDVRQLVREELEYRTNYDVIFFITGGYSMYGTPLFQVGNHYFSSYE